jgi:hypothetical protein
LLICFFNQQPMQVRFIKNIQFTKLLKAEGRQREFNFRKPNGRGEGTFTVDVVDDRGNRLIFRMEKEDTTWKIVPQPLPSWVLEMEGKLNELIEEELRNV